MAAMADDVLRVTMGVQLQNDGDFYADVSGVLDDDDDDREDDFCAQ